MRISGARCHILKWPEPNDFNHERMTVLVRVDTAAGISGWGEAIAMWPEACHAAVVLIEEGLLPLLKGRDPRETLVCWQAMKDHTWWYGEGGVAALAISALDMAIWDIAAKDAGLPLVEFLGGAAHQGLPACASLHVNQATIDDSVREIAGHIDAGFRSTKLGLGKRGLSKAGRDPDYDVALVAALRAAIGPDAGIMVDAGNGTKWDLDTAIRTVRRMEESRIAWIEEPFLPSRVDDHIALKAAVSTPIAAGEREWGEAGYRRWLDTGAVDIFGIDPARVEGITGFRRSAAAIEAAGKIVNAHAWSSAVLTAASLHLSLAAPSAILFELKPLPGPMQFELVEEPFWHENGLVRAPNRPGHGAEPIAAVIEKYKVG
ncbi:mandelate racemase/muconate lactonizing enzyme family protein [Kaistia algarum]|uniref:mandelate racemase/muconate lactonizing enzyme family protein n=1 Tax=Kaistia algarum TaxID=2083279 RepID=UPI0022509049|nr:mandelate racemase/muconate lactonizing enzyme family protein [Kaistia algarum]MCX5513289.1 mandelate racemase/muconate lactonizing enzyme family protein [Kaistia algarum]